VGMITDHIGSRSATTPMHLFMFVSFINMNGEFIKRCIGVADFEMQVILTMTSTIGGQ
jgi:hypothetical protein